MLIVAAPGTYSRGRRNGNSPCYPSVGFFAQCICAVARELRAFPSEPHCQSAQGNCRLARAVDRRIRRGPPGTLASRGSQVAAGFRGAIRHSSATRTALRPAKHCYPVAAIGTAPAIASRLVPHLRNSYRVAAGLGTTPVVLLLSQFPVPASRRPWHHTGRVASVPTSPRSPHPASPASHRKYPFFSLSRAITPAPRTRPSLRSSSRERALPDALSCRTRRSSAV